MTPIEIYNGIYVKRDDLCFSFPAPPFSKCRGIIEHLKKLKKIGIKFVAYTETSISMAGWGVAWGCNELGMIPIIFAPEYKNEQELLKYHKTQWENFNSIIIPIKAGMAKVNWYISKKIMEEKFKGEKWILLPLGLPLEETIFATYQETQHTINYFNKNKIDINTIIVCVGSGTICSGIYKGLFHYNKKLDLIGIMSRTGNVEKKKKLIIKKSGVSPVVYHFNKLINLQIIDEGWTYTEKSKEISPFPCHPFYDLKAWEYLIKHKMNNKVLFWNIGN